MVIETQGSHRPVRVKALTERERKSLNTVLLKLMAVSRKVNERSRCNVVSKRIDEVAEILTRNVLQYAMDINSTGGIEQPAYPQGPAFQTAIDAPGSALD